MRGAKIYAEISGYGCTADGYHLTKPLESGEGGYRAMKAALSQAEMNIKDIDNINCHATSTPVGDICEARAIDRLVGESAGARERVVVNAIKSSIGHTFGAAGVIESIFGILSIYKVKLYHFTFPHV